MHSKEVIQSFQNSWRAFCTPQQYLVTVYTKHGEAITSALLAILYNTWNQISGIFLEKSIGGGGVQIGIS